MDMRINYCIYKIPSPVPIVSQMNPIHLNMWSLPFGVSSQKPVWISVVHHVSHTPIYLIIYDFIILKVCVQVYNYETSVYAIYPTSCSFHLGGLNGFLTTLFMNTHNLCSYKKLYSN